MLVKLRVNSDLHIGLATRDNSLLAVTADCRIIGLTSRYQSTLTFNRLAAYRRLDSRGDRLQVPVQSSGKETRIYRTSTRKP